MLEILCCAQHSVNEIDAFRWSKDLPFQQAFATQKHYMMEQIYVRTPLDGRAPLQNRVVALLSTYYVAN
jgi:hypothetical protein